MTNEMLKNEILNEEQLENIAGGGGKENFIDITTGKMNAPVEEMKNLQIKSEPLPEPIPIIYPPFPTISYPYVQSNLQIKSEPIPPTYPDISYPYVQSK